jgi:hypothetical protein
MCRIDGRVIMQSEGSNGGCKGPLGSRFTTPDWRAKALAMDEKYTITVDDIFRRPFLIDPPTSVKYADVSIIVIYDPWFVPWHREKEFRFETRPTAGKLFWFARPVDG